jgi:hypothetical protein
MKATDAARILRPLNSLNHKHDPPVRVTCEMVIPGYPYPQVRDSMLMPVSRVVGGLPDPQSHRPVRAPRPNVKAMVVPMLGISSDHYYTHLTGREITRGNVTCPIHNGGNERDPSMRLYPDGTWFCFVCAEGGSIFQFAALLWGYPLPLRGVIFKEVRDRLQRELGVTDALR